MPLAFAASGKRDFVIGRFGRKIKARNPPLKGSPMPRHALTLALAATLLAAPALAQDATTGTEPVNPVVILPAPVETDANLQTTPETIKPASGSRCGMSKAVTS
jgi:hypothetical protein